MNGYHPEYVSLGHFLLTVAALGVAWAMMAWAVKRRRPTQIAVMTLAGVLAFVAIGSILLGG